MTNGGPTSPARQVPRCWAALARASLRGRPPHWTRISLERRDDFFPQPGTGLVQCHLLHQSWLDAPPSEVMMPDGSAPCGSAPQRKKAEATTGHAEPLTLQSHNGEHCTAP